MEGKDVRTMTIEELNEKAMEMIVSAGAGRAALNAPLDSLSEGNKEKYEELMKEAHAKMKEAHGAQTAVLQETITDPDVYPNILFTHAQDTLMTVMSEINTAKHIAKLYTKVLELTNEK